MKITFYSNFMNHHQLPLAKRFYSMFGNDYTFVALEQIPQERIDLGYHDLNKQFPFVLTTYDSKDKLHLAKQLAIESDIVVVGSAPDEIMKIRLPTGKLTYHSSERFFKEGLSILNFPRNYASALKHIKKFEKYKNYCYLCMSAYAAADINTFANYKDRTFKWGYFTEIYDNDRLIREKSRTKNDAGIISILWAGRFIEWKHPETALKLAVRLKRAGYRFVLKMIGNGEMKGELLKIIEKFELFDCVKLLGTMTPEEVRGHMAKADIFIFTSDFHEGWGAVLNEAMSSGCAVVCSHAVGAAPYLIRHGINGFVYQNQNMDSLYLQIIDLINNEKLRKSIGVSAINTMNHIWNADVAAERLIVLSNALVKNKTVNINEGPCSAAEPIRQSQMYSYMVDGLQ